MDYSYSFSDELQQEWEWSEKYASQPEILAYLEFVANKFDLNKAIRFSTRVIGADYNFHESISFSLLRKASEI